MRDEMWFHTEFVEMNLHYQEKAKVREFEKAQLRIHAWAARREKRGLFLLTVRSNLRRLARMRLHITVKEVLPEPNSISRDLADRKI